MEESESSYERIDSEIFLNGKNLNKPLIVSYNKKQIEYKEEEKQGRKNQKIFKNVCKNNLSKSQIKDSTTFHA